MLIGIDASRCIADRLTGTERYSREVIAAIVRIAPQHRHRLYFREGHEAQRQAYLGALSSSTMVEPVAIPSQRLWTHIGLRREVSSRPPDALFVPAHVLPIGLPPKLNAVVTVHDVGYRRFPQAHPLLQRVYLDWGTRHSVNAANVVIADSHATAQDIAQVYGIGTGKIRVAYPGLLPLACVTQEQIHATLAKYQLTGRPFAIHIGTLQPRKNLRR